MFPEALTDSARLLLEQCRGKGWKLTAAESCTGGLVMGLLTEIAGASDVIECGYVTYSNEAKHSMLGVPSDLLAQFGAVSEQVAHAMAEGARKASGAHIALAVTGIAGPSGGTLRKPVGLVYIARAVEGQSTLTQEHYFTGNRSEIRMQAVGKALELAYGSV